LIRVRGFVGSLTGLGGVVATPVLTLMAFALERDRVFVAITLAVPAILAYGLAGA